VVLPLPVTPLLLLTVMVKLLLPLATRQMLHEPRGRYA